ncbi:phosphotransferase family protein [Phytohabitans sp. LJ34]|uniref:phosphotransferase family protein n=1 Tax=Phytohabitans sp. LJ34 TaxID=3452217 RepID=UPI003F8AACD0
MRRPSRAWFSAAAATLPGPAWRVTRVRVSDTLVAVAVASCDATGRRVVLKVPHTAEGAENLRRQATALAALYADPRLAGWRAVVPRPLGQAALAGRPYWVEEALPGAPARTLDGAERVVTDLHARTAQWTVLGAAEVDAWIDRPLRRIGRGADRLRAELVTAVAGRRARTSWIHGDFWTGNVLAEGGRVTGIVDWDRAGPGQLPLHDLVHIRVMATRAELGDVVVRALRHGLAATLRVDTGTALSWLDGMPERPALLLYWLRHVALFIDSEGHRDNPRWLRGNVDRVLARI